ncbi:MAG: sporulation integral membrane protein YtvI [Bacillota bacterium]
MSRYIQTIVLIGAALALMYFSALYFIPEIFVILNKGISLLIPFIIAALISLLMEPAVNLLAERTRMSRNAAVALSMLFVFGGVSFLLTLAIFRLVKELSELSVYLPRYVKPVQEFIIFYFEQSKLLYFSLPQEVTLRLQESLGTITGNLSDMAGKLAEFLLGMASALPEAVLGIIVAIIATYFFSRDRELIVRLWISIIPSPWNDKSLQIIREIAQAFLSYVRAQAFLMSLTTLQAIVGLYIIGAKYALTMGLLIGLFDVLPLLGPASIIIPWAVWSFISGNIAFGIKLLILYLLLWLVRQTLEARVVAANLGLHPLAVLAVMYIGLKLIGFAGLILGPILLIAVQATYKALKKA